MFDKDAIHQRGKALEDEFFHRVDEKLISDLRAKAEREKAKSQLAAVTGFQNEELLDHLLDGGFEASTMTALALVPLVFVAWADGTVTPQERQTVMREALHRGIEQHATALEMVEAWLHKHPPRSLWKLWKEYAHAVNASVPPTAAEMLSQEIFKQSKAVAEASGGTLGFGKISQAEREILDEIEATFASKE